MKAKKLLSALLATAMTVSVMPVSAYANDKADPLVPDSITYDVATGKVVEEGATPANGTITLSKTAEYQGDGVWDVTLGVDSDVKVTAPATEVVFLLDASGSMNYCTGDTPEHRHNDNCYEWYWVDGTGYERGHWQKGALKCTQTEHYHDWEKDGAAYCSLVKSGAEKSRWTVLIESLETIVNKISGDNVTIKYAVFSEGVSTYDTITELKNVKPTGGTNLTKGLKKVIGGKGTGYDKGMFTDSTSSKKALAVISDGDSNDGYGDVSYIEYDGWWPETKTRNLPSDFKTASTNNTLYTVDFKYDTSSSSSQIDRFRAMASTGQAYSAIDADDLAVAMGHISESIASMIKDPLGSDVTLVKAAQTKAEDNVTVTPTGGKVTVTSSTTGGDVIEWLPNNGSISADDDVKMTYSVKANELTTAGDYDISLNGSAVFKYSYNNVEHTISFPVPTTSYSVATLEAEYVDEAGNELLEAPDKQAIIVGGDDEFAEPTTYETIDVVNDDETTTTYYLTTTTWDDGLNPFVDNAVLAGKAYKVTYVYSKTEPVTSGVVLVEYYIGTDKVKEAAVEDVPIDLVNKLKFEVVLNMEDLPAYDADAEEFDVDATIKYNEKNYQYERGEVYEPYDGIYDEKDCRMVLLKVYYSIDEIGGGEDQNKPDGILDKYQAEITYEVEGNGEVDPEYQVITLIDEAEKYTTSGTAADAGSTATADTENKFVDWTLNGTETTDDSFTLDSNIDLEETELDLSTQEFKGGEHYVFTASFEEDPTMVTVNAEYRISEDGEVWVKMEDGDYTISNVPDEHSDTVTVDEKKSNTAPTYDADDDEFTVPKTVKEDKNTYTYDDAEWDASGNLIVYYLLSDTEADVWTVTFDEGDHGTLKGETDFEYEDGEKITSVPTVKPDSGYEFDEWYCEELDEYYTSKQVLKLKVEEDLTFEAQYTKKKGGSSYELPEKHIEREEEKPALETEEHFQYISGYPDGTVRPNNNITRAEVATIFYRLLDDSSRNSYYSIINNFSDVDSTQWYLKAVATLTNAGILHGDANSDTFRPNDSITRAEFATIVSLFDDLEIVEDDQFSDISGHWAESYINSAAKKGWISGYTDGTFHPDSAITRAEAMTLINSVLNRKVDADGLCDGVKYWVDNLEGTWYYYQVLEATNYHDYTREDVEDAETWTEIQPNKVWNEGSAY